MAQTCKWVNRLRVFTSSCGRFPFGLDSAGQRFRLSTSVQRLSASPLSRSIVAASTAESETVRIIIKGRHLQLTDAIREYAEKKVSHAMSHYSQSIRIADVTLSVRGGDTGTKGKRKQKTEVTVETLRNGVIRSEMEAENLYASIDLVCDKLKHKLQKVKELALRRGTWPGKGGMQKGMNKMGVLEDSLEFSDETLDSEDESFKWEPEIVRTKRFPLEVTTAVEAAETLENLGHDFYLFRDEVTRQVLLVYKRREHGYGLIIPTEDGEK